MTECKKCEKYKNVLRLLGVYLDILNDCGDWRTREKVTGKAVALYNRLGVDLVKDN